MHCVAAHCSLPQILTPSLEHGELVGGRLCEGGYAPAEGKAVGPEVFSDLWGGYIPHVDYRLWAL